MIIEEISKIRLVLLQDIHNFFVNILKRAFD
uniref:Uncharacterized protein n=1 Tax=Anguilla anguilla TaxID=7936 RepID=A0A0E9RI26_ANGAN